MDSTRASYTMELEAIDKITKLLKEATGAEFLPLIKIEMSAIPENREITEAYEVFCKECKIGSRYERPARLAVEHPMMELCIEKALGDYAPIRKSIMKHGKLIDTGDGYIIDKENSSRTINLVLRNLKPPF